MLVGIRSLAVFSLTCLVSLVGSLIHFIILFLLWHVQVCHSGSFFVADVGQAVACLLPFARAFFF